ncbi:MAG: isoquinoline 1-oxidoreductase alpha subunit [Bacteroidia bacterium]|jgi:isoquinoline 1-oxidoreductase alpha subunit
MIELTINNAVLSIDAEPDTPLLWVLRDHLNMLGTKFGCGAGLCGACTVLLDGIATRSCTMPVSAVADQHVTTIEGLGGDHPVQQAWIAHNVPQCGYCQSGQIMSAVSLLSDNPTPSDAEIEQSMAGNICRCGTYPRIKTAIKSVSQTAFYDATKVDKDTAEAER